MADTNSIPILWYTDVIHKNSNQFNIISFLNGFANLFTIIETETPIAGFPYDLNKILMGSNEYYFVAYSTFHLTTLSYSLSLLKQFVVYMVIILLIRYICHVKM